MHLSKTFNKVWTIKCYILKLLMSVCWTGLKNHFHKTKSFLEAKNKILFVTFRLIQISVYVIMVKKHIILSSFQINSQLGTCIFNFKAYYHIQKCARK